MDNYTNHSNQQLLPLLAQHDEGAFAEIYRRYWKRMLAMAFLRLKRADVAEDLVQDVFAMLWQRREELDIQSLENWLSTAVKYKIITIINRQLNKEVSADRLPETAYTDTSIDESFLKQMVNEEINRLPEKCRIIFRYSREAGLSNEAIATRLNISEKAVEKHITSARRRLALTLRQFLQSFF
jgi:RNA polymerase sigma-70 factor (ECF subfamily)